MIIIAKLIYDLEYTLTFHSPGIEPWITGLLKKFKPDSVLDIGCGLGFWGLILKGYLGISKVVGVDINPTKVEFVKRLNVYDELYVSDIRSFNYLEPFDVVIAVESIHGILDENLLERLEDFVKRGGLIILALPLMSRSLTISDMIKRGYVVYRYFLRGFLLVRVDKAEVYTMPNRLWKFLGVLIKLLHKLLSVRLTGGYILAFKVA